MNKLEDINYALMAQLSYLHWNNLEDKKEVEGKFLEDILFKDIIISQIKTDFYNNPSHYPSNEIIAGEPGKLEHILTMKKIKDFF